MARDSAGLRARAEAVRPLLFDCRRGTENHLGPSAEILAALGEADLFRIGCCPDMGGFDATLADIWSALEILALGDPSVAWIVTNSGVSGIIASRLDDAARRQFLALADRPIGNAAVFAGRAVREGDSYRLSGRWPFCTGAEHASMFMCGAVVYEGDEPQLLSGVPEVRAFVVSAENVTVERTWDDASALAGTGSHAVTVNDALVDDRMSWSPSAPLTVDWPLYRIPRFPVFVGSAGIISLACLRTALDATIAANRDKVSNADGGGHWDRPTVQQTIAQADAAWRAQRLALYAVAEETWADARDGGSVSESTRARLYASLYLALDTATMMIGRLYTVATSATYATRNPVERALRDAHGFAASLETFRAVEFSAGRVLLGHPPSSPMF